MAKLTVFEIHAYKDGEWQTDSVFDDRELSVVEARRLVRTQPLKRVRVVEETYEDNVGKVSARVIYRSTRKRRARANKNWAEQILGQILGRMLLFLAILGVTAISGLFPEFLFLGPATAEFGIRAPRIVVGLRVPLCCQVQGPAPST